MFSVNNNVKKVDVSGLTISIASPTSEATEVASSSKAKGKSKAKAGSRELISDSHLRLKPGVHYGFLGRNGSGKSTLLRAMAEKIIPGISFSTCIAILQQTNLQNERGNDRESNQEGTVLEFVLSSDRVRNRAVQTANLISSSFESDDPLQPVFAIRKSRLQQVEEELSLARKNASFKSGARGLQARRDLKAAEAKLEISMNLFTQRPEAIDPQTIQTETQAALETLQDLQSQLEETSLSDKERQARQILRGLGFKEDALDKQVSTLSGGWRMRCMLASVLIQESDILILDEPTNFLDLLGIIWLENFLRHLRETTKTTVLLVSHDRNFLNSVCEEMLILRDQKLDYFRGNVAAYERNFEEKKLYWARMKEAQERQIAHIETNIRENIKIGKRTNDDNKLRQAKSRQKRIDDRMGVQVNPNGGRFKRSRDLAGFHFKSRADIEVPTDERGVVLTLPDATDLRFPGPLLSLEGVTFRYPNSSGIVLNSVNLVIHMGDRVGIMGLNGSGKTTLLRILTGGLTPSAGKTSFHPRLKTAYYSQHSVEELQEFGRSEPGSTALSLMMSETHGTLNEGAVRGLLSSLGLYGHIASDVPIAQLSGGQLARLALARIVWSFPQLLILDEISTHLDYHTVTALASALSSFNGAILLASHDRFLLRSVIEGKWDDKTQVDETFERLADEEEGTTSRRRSVYVLKRGKLEEQEDGVGQFEQSLARRVDKMLSDQEISSRS
ncbi:hypothetical protein DTO021D3_5181 [Paecilomyces variotii]|nr:hypothetical protein DTO032I3_6222 [Paecilomyces variotii]KAJ9277857.1 hypothetical protein DTO021D3_5181 [Paecilomyces variotii]KAJ9341520.1 hypothetical protein DTO027B6_5884 [Paecilomyces variotii]KAJ9379137.1 hypothetical protein DTO032I4_7394 [Paecilomyces variotii]